MGRPELHQGLHARHEQQMVLQPRMLQSIEVLQLPALELESWLAAAAEENEALRVELPAERGHRAAAREATERHDELLRSQPERDAGLLRELEEQLAWLELDPELQAWLELLLTCLDEHGYLSVTDEELLALGRERGLPAEPGVLGRAIGKLQRLEPRGIGGRDLVEALLLQLEPAEPDYPLLCRLVEEFLEDVARNKLPAVARALGVELDELERLLEHLRALDPRPGQGLAPEASPPIVPEVLVEREGDGYRVGLDRSALPSVTLDGDVQARAREREQPREVRRWLAERVERARWVVDAVRQREETLLRVARVAFERQREFLDEGPGHLLALSMGEVAELLGLHVSTVSRAVAGKHAQTPWGVLPLRELFQARGAVGATTGRDGLREAVRALFAAEDPRRPLSDDEAVERLAADGHALARRTVAKYRKELGIPSSYRRRKHGA